MSGGLRVVHLDGWCAVIDKPGGLLSVPGRPAPAAQRRAAVYAPGHR